MTSIKLTPKILDWRSAEAWDAYKSLLGPNPNKTITPGTNTMENFLVSNSAKKITPD